MTAVLLKRTARIHPERARAVRPAPERAAATRCSVSRMVKPFGILSARLRDAGGTQMPHVALGLLYEAFPAGSRWGSAPTTSSASGCTPGAAS
jgi:hypothetical protein